MAFNDNKNIGDIINSSDWNDFVDYTELISGSHYGHSSNKDVHFPSSQLENWFNSLYAPSGVSDLEYASGLKLGTPSDLDWTDGANAWTDETNITDAIDDLNEMMGELAPSDASPLGGSLPDNITLHSGKLASGANLTYKSGDGPTASVSYITDDSSITLGTLSFNKADEGTLNCYINGTQSGSVNLANAFNEDYRNSSQIYTPSTNLRLTVTNVGKYNNFRKWQIGSGQISVTTNTHLVNGYNWLYMSHEGISTPVSSNNYECWYDSDAVTSVSLIGTPKISENTAKIKYLSGIKHYYYGSTFDVTCSSQHCFRSAYRTDSRLFRIQSMTGHSAENISIGDGSLSGFSSYPVTGETATMTNKTITLGSYSARSTDARATCVAYNAYDDGSAQTASEGRLVDTYRSGSAGTSEDTDEYFDDEWYRLPGGTYDSVPNPITNTWDSTVVISDGSGQVYNGRLYYPSIDFTSGYLPSQDGSADFSGYSNNAVYYRAFYDSGTPHTNGQLQLGNLSDSDVDPVGTGDVNVEIKLPTQTGWLDLGTDYDSGSFTGSDGDGCQTSQSGDDWSWTSGVYSTANSGYMIIVRVTIRNSSKNLTQIRELGW